MNIADIISATDYWNETFYSTVFGDVQIKDITDDSIEILAKDNYVKTLTAEGAFVKGKDCILYPSKDCRDWIMWAQYKEEERLRKEEANTFRIGDYLLYKGPKRDIAVKITSIIRGYIFADSVSDGKTYSFKDEDFSALMKIERWNKGLLWRFDKVLVKMHSTDPWMPTFYSADGYTVNDLNNRPYAIIPYNNETEDLAGTYFHADGFYNI